MRQPGIVSFCRELGQILNAIPNQGELGLGAAKAGSIFNRIKNLFLDVGDCFALGC